LIETNADTFTTRADVLRGVACRENLQTLSNVSRYAGLGAKSWHHPSGLIGLSTVLHPDGGSKKAQSAHFWPSFGWSWYLAASCVSFVCANRLSEIAEVVMIAPTIIGTLFSSDRRQTPALVEFDCRVM
jgi:hypothetical protein